MSDPWRPMGLSRAEADVLHEGVPPWMETSFYAWVHAATERVSENTGQSDVQVVAHFDQIRRLRQPLAPMVVSNDIHYILRNLQNIELSLSYADFLLALQQDDGWGQSLADALEGTLESSGSAWRVGQRSGLKGLERRVDSGVQKAAEKVMESSEAAGELLSQAWHAAYGMNPDASKAYGLAIKAVEEAGWRRVSPANDRTTLGTMIRDIANQKTWHLANETVVDDPASSSPLAMMRSLWNGQTSRHGGNGQRPETPAEAESAVFLAVSLVQFFYAELFVK